MLAPLLIHEDRDRQLLLTRLAGEEDGTIRRRLTYLLLLLLLLLLQEDGCRRYSRSCS